MTSRPSTGIERLRVQAGIGSTGMRSISRTRKRNEREPAEMTIDARKAIELGHGVEQRLLDGEPRAQVARHRGAVAGHRAAEVDDAPHAGAGGRVGELLGRPQLGRFERRPPAAASMEWIR